MQRINLEERVVKLQVKKEYNGIDNFYITINIGDTIISYGRLQDDSGLFYSVKWDSFFVISEEKLFDFFSCLHMDYDDNKNIEDTAELSKYIRENYNLRDDGIYHEFNKTNFSTTQYGAFGFLVTVKEESFGAMIGRLLYEKGWTLEKLADKAYTTKQTISNIVSDKAKSPKRETVYAILLAFELPYDEFKRYLQHAGMTFNRSRSFDLVIEKFVKDGIYNMEIINKNLEDNGLEPYGYIFYNKE